MKIKARKSSGEQTLDSAERSENIWKQKQLLLLSFLCRIILVYYGCIHDYLFEVRFCILIFNIEVFCVNSVLTPKRLI
ncbi:unnamed protein product [Brugia timori]|uniref:Uncharacterized protein n=1 Tax=Brugia timori TaxID=42155 RepID=A0A0R3R0W7_9BILA|nr:unnamed protein product [Brugia timori]